MRGQPPHRREWWTNPRIVFPTALALVILVAIASPEPSASGRFGDARLSAHLSGSLGARVLADLGRRLGWQTVLRDDDAAPARADGRTIHLVLQPRTPLTPGEAHKYLEGVRGGDALLLVLAERNDRLGDSLRVRTAPGGVLKAASSTGECKSSGERAPSLWPDLRVHLLSVMALPGAARPTVEFAHLTRSVGQWKSTGTGAVGFPYGAGRVVVIADPDLLRNDVLRRCVWGADIEAVHMLEWLRAGGQQPRTRMAFDEEHQGFSARPGMTGVTRDFLVGHPVGRVILHLSLAALVLLLALAPRALPPSDVHRVERRDPLEQIDALARAYAQVSATRTAAQRLVRSFRWRHQRAASGIRSGSDESFITAVARDDPTVTSDVALVLRALDPDEVSPDLAAIGAALRRIEHSLTSKVS